MVPIKYYQQIQKIPWKSILKILGLQAKKINHGLKIKCIFHEEKTPSLRFFDDSGKYFCYGCRKKGDKFDFVAFFIKRGNKTAAMKFFARHFSLPLPFN